VNEVAYANIDRRHVGTAQQFFGIQELPQCQLPPNFSDFLKVQEAHESPDTTEEVSRLMDYLLAIHCDEPMSNKAFLIIEVLKMTSYNIPFVRTVRLQYHSGLEMSGGKTTKPDIALIDGVLKTYLLVVRVVENKSGFQDTLP
jgi:hypothetical protein